MPQARPIQTNFTGGEWSPRLYGRVDLDRYFNALRTAVNVQVQAHGGATRRSGTYFVAETKIPGRRVRLVRFEAATVAAYVLEFGSGYVRFYNNRGRLEVGGVPVEVATPYLEADLPELRFAQSADVLYITHKGHQPRKLSRTSATTFTLDAVTFRDGPYQPVNTTGVTMTPSARSGVGMTVTCSENVFTAGDVGKLLAIRDDTLQRSANGAVTVGDMFYSDDRGVVRLYRVVSAGTTAAASMAGTTPDYDQNVPKGETDSTRDGTAVLRYLGRGKAGWGYGIITELLAANQVRVNVEPGASFANTQAATEWRIGEWGGDRGWPRTVGFFQGRTIWGGSVARPQTLWFSETGDYESMAPSDPDGTVLDTNAVTLTLDDDEVQTIRWLAAQQRGLVVGTPSALFIVGPANASAAFSPTNARALRQSDAGSSDTISGFRTQGVALFVENGGQKVREFTYDFASDAFQAPDLSILSEHITAAGLTEAAYARRPEPMLWGVRSDGVLVCLTYDRDQQVRAWTRHTIGGGGLVESAATVASPNPAADDLYLVVNRGGTRWVEYLRPFFRSDRDGGLAQAYHVDGGLTYDGPPALAFSGLSHLDGQTVAVVADGADRGQQVVTGGQVTITAPAASVVHVGFPFTSVIETMELEAGAGAGTAQGVKKRIHEVLLRLHDTTAMRVGGAGGNLELLDFRVVANPMGEAVPLFSGDRRQAIPGGWERQGRIRIESVGGMPMTILAIAPEVTTNG